MIIPDHWRPRSTCHWGSSDSSDSGSFDSGNWGSDVGGSFTGSDTSGNLAFDSGGGSQFSSDSGQTFSSDGGQTYSSDGGQTYGDSGQSYSDSGQSYSGTDGGSYFSSGDTAGNFLAGDTGGGGYLGGSSLGGNVAADAAGGAPYGGGGAFGGGGFGGFQTAGQGQGGFGQFSTGDPANPLAGLDPLGQIYANEYGPGSLAGQLGYQDIGRNADQVSTPANLNPDLATQLGINDIGRTVAVDPTVQPGERGTFGPPQSAPAYTRGSGMDMEFNPFGMYQAPAQDQGRQGSLIDMLNPVSQARADMISTDLGRSDMPNIVTTTGTGLVGNNLSQLSPNELNTATLNQLATQFGRDPAVIADLLNNAPYEGALGGPDVVGSRDATTPGSQGHFSIAFSPFGGADPFSPDPGNVAPNQGGIFAPPNITVTAPEVGRADPFADPSLFNPDTYAPTRGTDVQTPAWLNAEQNLQQALQAQAGQQYQTPSANMPWGPTFSQPGLPVFDPTNMTFQTQTQPFVPADWNTLAGKTLDEQRAEAAQQAFMNQAMFGPPGVFGPPTTFQPAVAGAPPARGIGSDYVAGGAQARAAVDAARAAPAARGEDQFATRFGPERGISPQDRDAARAIERTVEREQSRPPLQVTVPGRVAAPPAQSRGSNQAAQQAARGDRSGLDALLNQARTAPTLAGRIAALDALNGAISAMRAAGLPNPYGRDPDPNIAAALRQGR